MIQLTQAEKDYNTLRGKVANYFGLHSTKKIKTETLEQILNLLENE